MQCTNKSLYSILFLIILKPLGVVDPCCHPLIYKPKPMLIIFWYYLLFDRELKVIRKYIEMKKMKKRMKGLHMQWWLSMSDGTEVGKTHVSHFSWRSPHPCSLVSLGFPFQYLSFSLFIMLKYILKYFY